MEGFAGAHEIHGLSAEKRCAEDVTPMDRELVLRARGGDAEALDQLARAAGGAGTISGNTLTGNGVAMNLGSGDHVVANNTVEGGETGIAGSAVSR